MQEEVKTNFNWRFINSGQMITNKDKVWFVLIFTIFCHTTYLFHSIFFFLLWNINGQNIFIQHLSSSDKQKKKKNCDAKICLFQTTFCYNIFWPTKFNFKTFIFCKNNLIHHLFRHNFLYVTNLVFLFFCCCHKTIKKKCNIYIYKSIWLSQITF